VIYRALNGRHRVGEAVTAGGFGGGDGVVAVADSVDSGGVMLIELLDPAVGKR